jgi:hypothetical protein
VGARSGRLSHPESMVRVRRTGRGMGLRIGHFTRMLST